MGLLDKFDLSFGKAYREGKPGPLLTADAHARYYEMAKNGRLFMQTTTPLGLAIPIYTGTAPRVGLWNPPDSGVVASIVGVSAQRASGTTVEFAAGIFAAFGVHSVATGSFLTAFPGAINVAKTNPINALLGGGEQSKVLSTASGTITATAWAAGDHVYPLFHSYAAIGTSTADGTPWDLDIAGKVNVLPGTFIAIAASVASVALYATTLVWEEVPL